MWASCSRGSRMRTSPRRRAPSSRRWCACSRHLAGVALERVLELPPSPRPLLARGRMLEGRLSVLVAAAPWSDPAQLRRFHRDLALLRGLSHPCVAPVAAGGEHGGTCWVAFLAPAGRPLEHRIGEAVDQAYALWLVRQLASGSAALLAAGAAVRAIGPRSLWVDHDEGLPEAQIVDLDLLEGLCGRARAAGWEQPDYLAPEQVRGRAFDARSQVYACGAILHHLLCGDPPFPDAEPELVRKAHLFERPISLVHLVPDLHPGTARLLERALAKEPQHRHQSLEEFQRACEDILGELGQSAPAAEPAVAEPDEPCAPAADGPAAPPASAPPSDITRRILAKHAQLKAEGRLRSFQAPVVGRPIAAIEPFTVPRAARPSEVLTVVDGNGWCDGPARERLRELLEALHDHERGQLPLDVAQRLEACGMLTREQAGLLETALEDQAILGKYRLSRRLRDQGDCRSYRGIALPDGAEVELMLLRVGSRDRRAAFLRGAGSALAVRHPRVVPLLGADAAGETCWTASRPVEGVSVADLVGAGRVAPEAWALRVLQHVAEGLACVHGMTGAPHLVVHPGAILLARADGAEPSLRMGEQAQLAEVGMSPLAPWRNRAAPYAAPELLVGGPADARCDIWSVGAVLYRLLTGRFPVALAGADGIGADERLEIHALTATILARTLAGEPDARYPDAQVLHAALAVGAGELSVALRVPRGARAAPRSDDDSSRALRRLQSRPSPAPGGGGNGHAAEGTRNPDPGGA